jgi:virginiamycin B lyase
MRRTVQMPQIGLVAMLTAVSLILMLFPSLVSAGETVGTMDTLKAQRVEAVIDVGGAPRAPDWQVTGDGAVWVANRTLSLVQRIDPATNAVTGVHDAIAHPCAGMAAEFGSIWVPSCDDGEIDRIDPRTLRVAARIKAAPADSEGQIAADSHGVWVVSLAPAGHTTYLKEIDPRHNRVAGRVRVPQGAVAVTAGFGALWVTVPAQGIVVRVDPVKRTVVKKIKVRLGARFLAAGEGGVWVLNQSDGSVSRISPATNRVVATIPARVPGSGGCVATGLGKVWVTMPGTPFLAIDPASNTVTERYTGDGGDCIGTGFGSVWLSNHQFGNVWRIKP